MKENKKIQVGIILGAHGVRGELRLRSLMSEPTSIFSFDELSDESGDRKFIFKRKGTVRGCFIVALRDVTDRNAAEALRGTKLFVNRSALPPLGKREYYEVDLKGLCARDKKGKEYGTVLSLHDYGAGAFLEIKPAKGASFMLPFNDYYVPEINFQKGYMIIVVPKGWLEKKKTATKERRKKTT